MRNWFRMVRVLIPLIAGCSLLVSLIATIVTVNFLHGSKAATGTIIDLETATNDDETLLYRPTFTFTVDGRDYSLTPVSYVSPSPGDVGSEVRVLYDPSRPSNARIDAFVYTWMIPMVTFSLGCVFGLIHLGIVWFSRNFRYVGADGG